MNVFGGSRVTSRVAVELNYFTHLLEAFAVLEDRCMYQAWQHRDETWRGWKALWECWSQPQFNSNPVVHVMSGSIWNGVLELFVRGTYAFVFIVSYRFLSFYPVSPAETMRFGTRGRRRARRSTTRGRSARGVPITRWAASRRRRRTARWSISMSRTTSTLASSSL